MKHTRRSIIGATGTFLITGCSSSGESSGSGGAETIIDDRDTVNEDQYLTYTFTLNKEGTLDMSATVRDGPPLDIVFTSQDELAEFEAGNRFRYNEDLSFLDSTGGNGTLEAPEGDYALIVDNTNRMEAQPPTNMDDDNARVEIHLTVS